MKTIKVLIAASEELRPEVLEFTNLIEHLNKVLRPRGIELKRIKWNSDEYTDDYQEKLKDCQFCLKLYWQTFCEHSDKELDIAYNSLKRGDNPRNLYVFFKEPANDISDALKDFKANFVTNYGHFFCKFENVDTMNLHFILQFESIQNQTNSELVVIKEGQVLVDGESFVNMDNVPFATQNQEYQRLRSAMAELNKMLIDVRAQLRANPDNEVVEDDLFNIRKQRESNLDELEKYQRHLYNIALCFANKTEEHYSDRLSLARELFEKGDVSEADSILDLDMLKLEAKEQLRMFEQNKGILEIKIEEFHAKARMVMANTTIQSENRYDIARQAYVEAINIAEKIGGKDVIADLKTEYACFHQTHNRTRLALYKFEEALSLYKELSKGGDLNFLLNEANVLVHLGQISSVLEEFPKAESYIKDALSIYKGLSQSNNGNYDSYIAYTLSDLARLYISMSKQEEFKKTNDEALALWQELSKIDHDRFHPELARTLARGLRFSSLSQETQDQFWLADIKCYSEILKWKEKKNSNLRDYIGFFRHRMNNLIRMNRFQVAKEQGLEGIRIIEKQSREFPDIYYPDLAYAYGILAEIDDKLNNLDEAEKNYKKAIRIWKKMVAISPEAFTKRLPVNYKSLAVIHINQMKFEEAEMDLKEIISIWEHLYRSDSDLNKEGYIESLKDLMAFYDLIKANKKDSDEFQKLITLTTEK